MLLWLRGLVFTLLVPVVVGFYVPSTFLAGRHLQPGAWQAGWVLVILGAATYLVCLIQFLTAGGTPAIFFARHLRFLIGEEPTAVVRQGIYRISRNPMYLGLVLSLCGWARLLGSPIGLLLVWLFARLLVIVQITPEEAALRERFGDAYLEYCLRVNRWLGRKSVRH